MGFFSWKTADTRETVWNRYSDHGCRTVYLLQPNGGLNIREDAYEGYGDFGGVDVYEWLAIANKAGTDREAGIDLQYSEDPTKYPIKLSFNSDAVYEKLEASEECQSQGFFDWGD